MESYSPAHSTSIENLITAQTGGNVCAPVIDRNTIQGSLTIITNIHGAQEASTCSSSTVQDVNSALTEELITACKQHHKSKLKKKYSNFTERLSYHGISTPLNEIYTEIYITEGGSGEVNNEHEVRQIETTSRRKTTQERPIKCNDIFKRLPGQDKPIRTVLTRGIAGIGKTVSVQKFILDWAEGKANQDITFIFPLTFRKLNLIKERKLSLLQLLHLFFPTTKEFPLIDSDAYKILLIFDGLDECQLPLHFQDNEIVSDVTESTSVDVLLTNLINENLIPSALLWITSRPAAANQIPPEWVDQVTEVRGFSDPQKEEYFRKRIRDRSHAEKIITHIKSSRSLYIMCHIPVFCWISAIVLERMWNENENIPTTLTQMFIYFLNFQIKHKAKKYHKRCNTDLTREKILALGKLAFQQLERGNLIFYEDDLRECGIDVNEASVYSGVCTQIFREEFELHLGKVFSFVHLSVQEFLAALFAFLSFISDDRNVLLEQATGYLDFGRLVRRSQISDFLNYAVDKALRCENGHLDLFLRFLLGLSLESNQILLRGLLPQTASDSHSKDETVKYIKEKIRENDSPEKSINLFHCLNELNEHSLVQEVQMYLNRRGSGRLSGAKLSPAQWSALVFVLLNSEEELDEFDLNKYDKSDECLLRLLPVVKASRKAMLCECNLTEKSCSALAEALSSNSSVLRKLNLSNNKLKDTGVELLSAGLGNPHCKLETLRLQRCRIREEGCAALAKALKSNPSHLRELELSYNYLGDLGVKELSALLEDPHCKLEKLQLSDCNITEEGSVVLIQALKSNPSHLRELNLSDNAVGDSGAKELSDLLKDPDSKLKKLELCYCNLKEKNCTLLASAIRSNLIELDLSNNELQDSGVKLLSDALKNPQCKIEMLGLEVCSITEEGCVALATALKSNPSHLKELNLNYNKPGDSGVKELCGLLKDPHCKLEKLQLDICCITEEGCVALIKALKSNPLSHLRELNLNYNKLGDSGVKELFYFLGHPYCKLEKLLLNGCNLTQKGCAALVSALSLNSSTLRELDLSNNKLQDSGVQLLSTGLENPQCKMEILRLVNCNITEKGFYSLLKALKSNPIHLRQLDLNHNEIRESGMTLLSDLLKDPHCYLEKLLDKDCESQASPPEQLRDLNQCYKKTEAAGEKMNSDLLEDLNCKLRKQFCVPSNSRELNLNFKKVRDSGMNLLSGHLEDPKCKVEKLLLRWCSLSGESCAILASVLSTNSSCLRELDLSNNRLQDSGVQLLCVGLENPQCLLEILSMSGCNLTEKCCAILASVLSSDSSRLRELNLSNNKLQDSGVKLICAGLENPQCKLMTLKLKYCSITEEGCSDLFQALKSNSSSQLRELNLSLNKTGESGVKLLSFLVENPHYKLAKLDI
uniref:NACHT domain-containing protein n=2 Tax=Pygocentrus nattereri TaxID=42514 RepID=A0A3B4CSU3_PYGNA